MSGRRWIVGIAGLLLAAGCSVSPPRRLREGTSDFGRNPIQFRLALEPIELGFIPDLRGVAADTLQSFASPPDSSQVGAGEAFGPSFRVRADLKQLQANLEESLRWSKIFEEGVVRLETGDELRDFYQIADEAGARMLMKVRLDDSRVRYVGTAGLVWWLNMFNYFIWSPPFAWWVPDESFAVDLAAHVELLEVRTQTTLFAETFEASHEEWLNEFMHGWLVLGLFRAPSAFESENWLQVYDQLFPYAELQFEQALLDWLSRTLASFFEGDAWRIPFEEGSDDSARTHAVIVGVPGEGAENADRDAQAVEAFLAEHSGEGVSSRTVLTGSGASREAILKAVEALQGTKTLKRDRVVFYFSGRGLHDADGFKLDCGAGAALPLEALREAMGGVASTRVLFLLDTSFGGSGGRTHPDSLPIDPEGYLAELGDPERGWRAIVAAGPEEAAWNLTTNLPEDERGLLTSFLTSSGRSPRDTSGDGELSLLEIFTHLRERVPPAALAFTGLSQTPLLIGSAEDFKLKIGD